MKYYVVSDVHGFYTPLIQALTSNGFFTDAEPHKLIVCGDMLDRGKEAVKVQNFMVELLRKNELIFIRGNHEDLFVDMLDDFYTQQASITNGFSHYSRNGTFSSALQLAQIGKTATLESAERFIYRVKSSEFFKTLLPASINYFETKNYVFVHGWIPCNKADGYYTYNPDWREAHSTEWEKARWFNGMLFSEVGNIFVPNKTVVCGHWHASFGHSKFEGKGSEFGKDADFSPFYGKHVIGIDACTACSKTVNCIVIND